jgi:serine O-acetyltransferase
MNNSSVNEERDQEDGKTPGNYYLKLPSVVESLVSSWKRGRRVDQEQPISMPSHESVVRIIHRARNVLFPGYFIQTGLDPVSMGYYLGQETTALFEDLSGQIIMSLRHDNAGSDQTDAGLGKRGYEIALRFVQGLPEVKSLLDADIEATLEGDPAAKSHDEIIFSYPGLFAVTVYRLAHILWMQGVPLLPRIMTEYAHGRTGIDIHPGARIGKSLCIDHGTGVVVGETTEIGDRVRIYQGVTLGALSLPKGAGSLFKNKKRHPTIEDDVIIYSNTTILGGETVIGARSVIGGNIWITESVPPDTKVLFKRPELVYKENGGKTVSA